MFVPLSYNVRSVTQRWRNTGATILAIGLAVAVIIMVFALRGGIEKSLMISATDGNALIMRASSTAELNSVVTPENVTLISYLPGIARGADGAALVSPEFLTTQNLPRAGGGDVGVNVSVRGLGPMGFALRPRVTVLRGAMFRPGMQEVIVSDRLSKRFGLELGETVQLGRSRFTVAGITDASGTAYESEIWGDVDEIRRTYAFEFYSVLLARVEQGYAGPLPAENEARIARQRAPEPRGRGAQAGNDGEKDLEIFPEPYTRGGERLRASLKADRRLSHTAKSEQEYFKAQTVSGLSLQILGTLLTMMMGPGAALTAMNAMYAAIASRTREIGTLRVLGFRRWAVLLSFMIEAVVLAAIGGAIGCALSYGLMHVATSFDFANFGTMNFLSFSEIIFQFRIEPPYLVGGFVFALCVGFFGGLLPAFTASRIPILSALKSA